MSNGFTEALLQDARAGVWRDYDGKLHDLTKIQTAILQKCARRLRKWAAGDAACSTTANEVFNIYRAELTRRGAPVDTIAAYRVINEGGPCAVKSCDRPAHVVYGHAGYCDRHEGLARRLRAAKSQKIDAKWTSYRTQVKGHTNARGQWTQKHVEKIK